MIVDIFLLVSALCVDIFVASTAYGTNGVRLSGKQIAVINAVSSLCLGVSLLSGTLLDNRIPEQFTREICFYSLLIIGCIKLMDSSIRQFLKHHKEVHKDISFVFSQLRFLISIYSDPMEADQNKNHHLSWKELILFSLAMAIDCLITGTMAAFLKIPILPTTIATFLTGECLTYIGLWLGRKLSAHSTADISWVGGILFIILAVTRH